MLMNENVNASSGRDISKSTPDFSHVLPGNTGRDVGNHSNNNIYFRNRPPWFLDEVVSGSEHNVKYTSRIEMKSPNNSFTSFLHLYQLSQPRTGRCDFELTQLGFTTSSHLALRLTITTLVAGTRSQTAQLPPPLGSVRSFSLLAYFFGGRPPEFAPSEVVSSPRVVSPTSAAGA